MNSETGHSEIDLTRPPSAVSAPLFTVVIPVRNNRDGVCAVLECLERQTVSPKWFEVIVGDDGSTPPFEAPPGLLDGRVRVVRIPPRTSYAARNAAAAEARGSILAFTDSDCLPDPRWLEEAHKELEEADVVAGEVTFLRPGDTNVWSLLTIDMFLDQGQNVKLSRGVTANLIVRRELFEDMNGFDETLPSGGDYEFVDRAVGRGARLRYGRRSIVRHPTMKNRQSFLRKIWNYNRWSAVRRARQGARLDILGALGLVPIVGVAISRIRALRPPYGLSSERLAAAGITPSLGDHIRGLTALYCLVCYVAGVGRAAGWIEGRRRARRGEQPRYATAFESRTERAGS